MMIQTQKIPNAARKDALVPTGLLAVAILVLGVMRTVAQLIATAAGQEHRTMAETWNAHLFRGQMMT